MNARMAILSNEVSGGGSDPPAELEAAARRAGVVAEVVPRGEGQDLSDLARELVRSGYRTLVAAGGDGTVSAVAAGIFGEPCTLGVLPLGTFNHLARDLGIPLDLPSALATLRSGRTMAIDVGEVNGHIFLNNSSIGLYPLFVSDRERQQRELNRPKWSAAILACLAALRIYPMLHVAITVEGQRLERRTPLLFVGNNEYEFQGLWAGRRRCIGAGKLCLLVTRATGRLGLLWLAVNALLGRLGRASDFDALTTTELDVHIRRRRMPVAMDGEVRTLPAPLRYRIHPQALRVIVPAGEQGGARGAGDVNAAASV